MLWRVAGGAKIAILLLIFIVGNALSAEKLAWTVMIYMNANSPDLNDQADPTLKEIVDVGSTDNVKIVVQCAKLNGFAQADQKKEAKCLRFTANKGQFPLQTNVDFQPWFEPVDMGSEAELRNFVKWTHVKYPAEHNILIIWDHGQGWHFVKDSCCEVICQKHTAAAKFNMYSNKPTFGAQNRPLRAITFDALSHNVLYNQQIKNVLLNEFGPRPQNKTATNLRPSGIDIIGFDACLMQMVETCYAMRNVAGVMVASEQTIPITGWPYKEWLKKLADDPTKQPVDVARDIVCAYELRYQHNLKEQTTLSATLLEEIQPCAEALSELAKAIMTQLSVDQQNSGQNTFDDVTKAREMCACYGAPYGQGIDCYHFCDQLAAQSKCVQIQKLSKIVCEHIEKTILKSYACPLMNLPFYVSAKAQGVAIYFPLNVELFAFEEILYRDGMAYLKDPQKQQVFPVEFVQEQDWADFLAQYYHAQSERIYKRE